MKVPFTTHMNKMDWDYIAALRTHIGPLTAPLLKDNYVTFGNVHRIAVPHSQC